jgi:hypothetical protein
MNKTPSKKAAKIAETAKTAGGMFVFATRDPNLIDAPNTSAVLSKFKYTQHACTDCGHEFQAVAAAGLQYHCMSCGSSKTQAKAEASTKLDLPADDKLALVTCGSCATHNITAGAVLSAVSQLNCTACGHEMNYKLKAEASTEKADADEMPDNDMDPITDVDDMDLVDIDDDDDDVVEDDSGDELFDDDDMDTAATKTTAAGGDDPNGTPALEDQGMAGDNNPDPDPQAQSRKNTVEQKTQDGGLDIEVDLSDVETERDGPDAKMATEPTAPAIAFVYLGSAMNIAVGNRIVATLTPELAGDNAELMHQKHFQLAVKHSIETLGLKEAMRAYNFQAATVKVRLAPEIAKLVEAGVAEKSNQVTAGLDSMAKDFGQAMDIAVAGWAQNFWRNRTSPVKAALVSELVAAGLKSGSAEKLVDRVFAAHGVADAREVLTIARELAAKPVEARNGLAEAVNLTKYLPFKKAEAATEDMDDAGEDDEDDDNEVVATVATAVQHVQSDDNQVTATHYKTPELARLLGDKTFSS